MPTVTPNMALQIPDVGSQDYPSEVQESLEAVDEHDHTTGKGVLIPTAGVADLAITAAKIAANAITTAKILALNVTRPKLAAVGEQVSSASAFSTTSATPVDVTDLTVSITTTGRPVVIALISDGTAGTIQMANGSNVTVGCGIYILEGASVVAAYPYVIQTSVTGQSISANIPCSSIFMIRPVAAGTYAYKIQAQADSGTTVSFSHCKLIAYEL